MSGSVAAALFPQPERWGAIRAGNVDTRTRDTSGDLATINDTIASVSVTCARVDGATPTGQDLGWTGAVSLDATRRVVSVNLAVGVPPGLTATSPVDNVVTITVATTGGRTLAWDAYQLVVARIG